MAKLPALATGIDDWDSFEEGYLTDPTVRDYGSGRPLTRPGCEPLVKWWRYIRRGISTTDKMLWDNYQADVLRIGGVPFYWEDSRPWGGLHTVRLGSPIEFDPMTNKVGYYNASLYLIEEVSY